MPSLETITLLNANGIDMNHVPGGEHGLIDREAVCMALRGSTRAEFGLALYKDAGEKRSYHDVWGGLFIEACEAKEYKEFSAKNPHKLNDLCHLAIVEYCTMPHCKACNGTAKNEQYETCKACKGSGVKSISDLEKAKIMGKKDHSSWRPFKVMFAVCTDILSKWDYRNKRKLKRLR